MNKDQEALVKYRLEQTEEAIASAQLLFENKKLRSSINRSYYAMFYAVLALLAIAGLKASKHSGVISVFNREFVKKGIFPRDFSRWLQEAFDLRQRADYRELFAVTQDRTERVLAHAKEFLVGVRAYIERKEPKESD
jgi:uncharacterized protein (UPF0332 family)